MSQPPLQREERDGKVRFTFRTLSLRQLTVLYGAALALVAVSGAADAIFGGGLVVPIGAPVLGVLPMLVAGAVLERGAMVGSKLRLVCSSLEIETERRAGDGYRGARPPRRLHVDGRPFALDEVREIVIDHAQDESRDRERRRRVTHTFGVYVVLRRVALSIVRYPSADRAAEAAKQLADALGVDVREEKAGDLLLSSGGASMTKLGFAWIASLVVAGVVLHSLDGAPARLIGTGSLAVVLHALVLVARVTSRDKIRRRIDVAVEQELGVA